MLATLGAKLAWFGIPEMLITRSLLGTPAPTTGPQP